MAMELFSENRIGELEEKIDGLINNYMAIKKEKSDLLERIQALETESKGLRERVSETKSEREIIMDKVIKILEKVEKAEV